MLMLRSRNPQMDKVEGAPTKTERILLRAIVHLRHCAGDVKLILVVAERYARTFGPLYYCEAMIYDSSGYGFESFRKTLCVTLPHPFQLDQRRSRLIRYAEDFGL